MRGREGVDWRARGCLFQTGTRRCRGLSEGATGKAGAFWDQRDEDIHGLSNLFLGFSSAEGSFEAGLRGTGGSWEPRPQLLLIQPSPLPGLLRTLQYSLT